LEKADKTTDDNKSQEESKSVKNQEVTSIPTDGPTTSKKPSKVPTDDSTDTIKVTRSDKLNNKLSDKPDELAEIVSTWRKYPKQSVRPSWGLCGPQSASRRAGRKRRRENQKTPTGVASHVLRVAPRIYIIFKLFQNEMETTICQTKEE
jgi:hypothetical protein